MLRQKNLVTAAISVGSMGAIGILASCLSDPRASDTVTVIDTCDLSKLSSSPTSPESSLIAYVRATEQLVARSDAAEAQLKDGCNAINTELALPIGQDVVTACRGISTRIAGIIKRGIPPFGAGAPEWAEFRFAANCATSAGTREKCVAACAGTCDTSKCDAAATAGKCNGKCKGTCTTVGKDIACGGKCIGDTVFAKDLGVCTGECSGVCAAGAWAAKCDASCSTSFLGVCGGTCTGSCDGQPINVSGGDAGADAAAPPAGGPPPSNADGNCKGTCVGVCSGKLDGFCNGAPCLKFNQAGPPDLGNYSGYCPGNCGGLCRSSIGVGTTGTCTGECTETKDSCSGICHGGCDGTIAEPTCEGSLSCGQNKECSNACEAQALLASTCDSPSVIEAFSVTDPALYAAFTKVGGGLGKASTLLPKLRSALSYISDRSYSDFVAIKVEGDRARVCVETGRANVAKAQTKFATLFAADPTTYKSN